MAELSDLPELVRQFRLETVIDQTKTVHTLLRGQRRLPSRVTWERVTERPLGHGGYGEVWLEKRVGNVQDHTPGLRAVKSIYTNSSSQRRDYVRELEALAKFSSNSHKYAHFFVQFYGWYESPGRLHAAMEYCEHGDLNKYIKSVGRLTEKETKDIIWQVLGGLSLMHEANFAHRDIKPANILIKSCPPAEWWVKLCDLGLSKRAEDNASATVMRGTPGFMAPEKLGLNSEDTDGAEEVDPFPADMWCLGETISHAVTGHGTFEPHLSFYRYASGESDFPRFSFRKHSVSEECIDFIQSLMSPRPKDRLLASQALFHSWIAIEDESDLDHISDVGESPVTPVTPVTISDGEESSQRTQASAAWTQETAKCTGNLADRSDGILQESKDDDGPVTMSMGMSSVVADTRFTTERTAKRTAEKRLSNSGRHPKMEDSDERSPEPDGNDHPQCEESSRTRSDSEDSDPHEDTPTNKAYMEDADEDGNPIEGTQIYPTGKRRRHLDSRRESLERNETQPHSRTRSSSPVGHGHRTSRQRPQNGDCYSPDENTQHPVKTRILNIGEFVIQAADARDHDQSVRYLDALTFEYYPNAYDEDPNRIWLADAFGNIHGLARTPNQVNRSHPNSNQEDQETDTSVIDGTRPGPVESGDARDADRRAEIDRLYLSKNYISGDYSNASASSDRRRTDSHAWDQGYTLARTADTPESVIPLSGLQKWRNMPDNATQYCPSVSTISIIDSEDEGTLPYALKRIQRDFPSQWKHHPLGRSYDDIDWHQHSLRLYERSPRGRRDSSTTMSLPVRAQSILRGAEASAQGEKSPKKKVRWDDDPRVGNIRRSEMFKSPENNIPQSSRAEARYPPDSPPSPTYSYPHRWWDT